MLAHLSAQLSSFFGNGFVEVEFQVWINKFFDEGFSIIDPTYKKRMFPCVQQLIHSDPATSNINWLGNIKKLIPEAMNLHVLSFFAQFRSHKNTCAALGL